MDKLKAWMKKAMGMAKKPKRLWIHFAMFAMMALALYLAMPHMLMLKMEWMRMMVAMMVGAYGHKPCADWACRKLLDE